MKALRFETKRDNAKELKSKTSIAGKSKREKNKRCKDRKESKLNC